MYMLKISKEIKNAKLLSKNVLKLVDIH